MAASALIASGLHAGYPGEAVLTGIDLTITAGDPPLGVVGPSGVGKTTLVRALHGTLSPSEGTVTFNGKSVSRMRGKDAKVFKAAVRFMSQDSLTITDPRETPEARLKAAAKEARKGGRTHAVTPEEMLATVGLEPRYLRRLMGTLSGGERQRVALATALATRPEILILDEPLTAVDPATRGEIARGLAETIARLKIGVLAVSHDLELIGRLCPEIVFLAEGQIVARGSVAQVLATSTHPEVQDLAQHAPQAVQRFR